MKIRTVQEGVQRLDKRVEGTFGDYQSMLVAITEMLEDGYTAQQLLVIARDEDARRVEDDTGVAVMVTSDKEDSLWDKIVSFFTVETEEDAVDESGEEIDEEEIFEDYGIDGDTYDRFEEALDNGEYLLLVDDAPPAHEEFAEFMVRDGIIPEEEDRMSKEKNNKPMDETKKSATPDWVDTNGAEKGDVGSHSLNAEKQTDNQAKEAAHQAPHPDPQPGVTGQDHVEHNIPQSEHPDPVVDSKGEEVVEKGSDPSMEPGHQEGDHTLDSDDSSETENQKESDSPSRLKYDEGASHPENETKDKVSKDPFGYETETVDKGEGGEDVHPEYDETDKNPPAL